jgi:cytochrome c biogenesis protein ResB
MADESSLDHSKRRDLRWVLREFYDLLSDPTFAILVVIALAVASIIGLIVVDQVPFRGEMARVRYTGREHEPWIWFLIHVMPANPFRTAVYRTLLAFLSLSLAACTLKRWRRASRLAFGIANPPAGVFGSGPSGRSGALVWVTRSPRPAETIVTALKRSLFAVRTRVTGETTEIAASRFGLARLGPVLTHFGFLMLVAGGLWISIAGMSRQVWMSPGDTAEIPGSTLRLDLHDFRVETNATGEITQYISSATLYDGDREVRRGEIKVNHPLRYRGFSFYQSSYRQDPSVVRAVDLMIDAAPRAEGADPPPAPAGMRGMPPEPEPEPEKGLPPGHPAVPGRTEQRPPHEPMTAERFLTPVSVRVPRGEWVPLPGAPYEVAIDTFFVDFRIDANGPTLASDEPRNPAVRLRFRRDGQDAGATWFFLLHPEMPVGSGPSLPLRVTDYTPVYSTGLEVVTHPGSGWVWAGFAVMTLGTIFAFLLRHERIWLRVSPRAPGTEIALVHQGAPCQAPEYIREPWEAATTSLAIRFVRDLAPEGGRPARWPGAVPSEGDEA